MSETPRFVLKRGRFGLYIYDQLFDEDVDMEQIEEFMNLAQSKGRLKRKKKEAC